MERGLLLDIVVRQSTTILELLSSENEALLVGQDTFLILNLRLHALNRVRGLGVQRDRLTSECLDEDLHQVFYL